MTKKRKSVFILIFVAIILSAIYISSEKAVIIISEEVVLGEIGDLFFSKMNLIRGERYNVEIIVGDIKETFDSPTLYSNFYPGDKLFVKLQNYKRPFTKERIRIQLVVEDGFLIMD